MSRLFYHVMQDNAGNLLFDVSGTMRLAGSGTLATIYGDEGLTVILPNPMTNHPSFGSFKCYLGPGDYDFYMAKSGYTFETLTGVQGWGTLAEQNASSVQVDRLGVFAAAPATAGHLAVQNVMSLGGAVPSETVTLFVLHQKASRYGLLVKASGVDVGNDAMTLQNMAGTVVGNITYSAVGTSYNTTSDVRLKHAIETLTGELDLVQALRPVRFRWLADDTPGVGFIASEVAAHVQGVITGEADAVDEAGSIIPQMIDYSKLVPFLTGAVQTLAAQVESLTARLVVLEDALGI